jgi:Fe2+ or Zn2+ uptake regulation protein
MDNQQHRSKHDRVEVVLAAMNELGEATAAAIAAQAGFAYSTITSTLRALENAGRAHRVRTEGRTTWRPTTTTTDTAPAADTPAAPEKTTSEPAPRTPAEPTADADPSDTTDPDQAPTNATTLGEAPIDAQPADPAAPQDEDTPGATADEDKADNNNAHGADASPSRRPKGALREAVLAILRRQPDTAFKISELSKLLDGASQGAIANAVHKLAAQGSVEQTIEKPATFKILQHPA